MVKNPTGGPADLPIYRREAFNTSGCVSGIEVGGRGVLGGAPGGACQAAPACSFARCFLPCLPPARCRCCPNPVAPPPPCTSPHLCPPTRPAPCLPTRVQWITRTDTVGGVPPSPICTQAEANTTQGIQYKATFIFWDCP